MVDSESDGNDHYYEVTGNQITLVELLLEDYPEIKLVPSNLAAGVKGLRSEEAFSVLRETYPESQISLILGDDTIKSLMVNQVRIPENFQLLVSRREGNEAIEIPESLDGKPVHVLHVSEESSSTKVRKILSEGGVPEMLPPKVYKFIKSQKLYTPAPLKPVPLPGNCLDVMNSFNQAAQ